MICANCKYFVQYGIDQGHCHRYPRFAIVDKKYWCGEYQERTEPKVELKLADQPKRRRAKKAIAPDANV